MEISAVNANQAIAASLTQTPAQSPENLAKNREIIQAVKKLNQAESFGNGSELTFVMDRNTGRPLIRIIDKATKEVLQQIPSEYALQRAEQLKPG